MAKGKIHLRSKKKKKKKDLTANIEKNHQAKTHAVDFQVLFLGGGVGDKGYANI